MACNDRQLSQAQREAGYDQQRTGVPRAVRPFSGAPTLENLLDYLNRELVPAVQQTRGAVNDVFLQVADQAPSANPLAYYFSTNTANSDPTDGRVKLNAATQNTASIIRISQSNARLQDVTPWLDVMSGGPTTPLGTVTLIDSINPGRFLRFDLNTMTDAGAYWNLGVTFIEGSHTDPFVEDEAVVLAFISGVSAAGSTVPVGSLSPVANDTFLGNVSGAAAAPSAVNLSTLAGAGLAFAAHTLDVTGSTSITVTGDQVQRAALTGAIAATANSNATLFAGIRDNGSAESDRTNLNFITTTDIALAITDDAANDELEIRATLAAGSTQNEGTGGAVTLDAGTKVLAITSNISISGIARTGGNVDGDRFWIRCNDGIECELEHATGTAANQFSLPYADDLIVPGRGMIEFRYEGSWRAISTGNKGRLLRVTVYDTAGASGTHNFLSDARYYSAYGVAGGNGGGGSQGAAGECRPATGGGPGAYFEIHMRAVASASVSYEVGSAGVGGIGATNTAPTVGSQTTIDGDGAGPSLVAATNNTTGALGFFQHSRGGAAVGTVDVLVPGDMGSMAYAVSATLGTAGNGSSSKLGSGGAASTRRSGAGATDGSDGQGFGSGGGGGMAIDTTSDADGGDGKGGLLVVLEWT